MFVRMRSLLMMMVVIGVAWTPLAVSGADSGNSGRLHQRLARLKLDSLHGSLTDGIYSTLPPSPTSSESEPTGISPSTSSGSASSGGGGGGGGSVPAPSTLSPSSRGPSASPSALNSEPAVIYNASLPSTPRGPYYNRTELLDVYQVLDASFTPSSSCQLLSDKSRIIGYQVDNERTPIYHTYCAGTCFSVLNSPSMCQASYASIYSLASNSSSLSYQNASIMNVVTDCSCQSAGCSVIDMDTGHLRQYSHAEKALSRCQDECTCWDGQLANCNRRRKEWVYGMNSNQRQRYIDVLLIASTTQPYKAYYDELIQIHSQYFYSAAYSLSTFLPFHRWWLLEYENLLREIDCRITLPYWDFTLEAVSPFESMLWMNESFGGNGDFSKNACVSNGPFAFPSWTLPNGACLQRNFNLSASFATVADIAERVLAVTSPSLNSYSDFVQYLIYGPGMSGSVMCSVGGTLCSNMTASAPEFVLLMAFMDSLWTDLQLLDSSYKNYYFSNTNMNVTGSEQYLSLGSGSTAVLESQILDNQNITYGNVTIRVSYVHPKQFEWIPLVLIPLNISALIQSVPRIPVVDSTSFSSLFPSQGNDMTAYVHESASARNGGAYPILSVTDVKQNTSVYVRMLGIELNLSMLGPLIGNVDLTNSTENNTPAPEATKIPQSLLLSCPYSVYGEMVSSYEKPRLWYSNATEDYALLGQQNSSACNAGNEGPSSSSLCVCPSVAPCPTCPSSTCTNTPPTTGYTTPTTKIVYPTTQHTPIPTQNIPTTVYSTPTTQAQHGPTPSATPTTASIAPTTSSQSTTPTTLYSPTTISASTTPVPTTQSPTTIPNSTTPAPTTGSVYPTTTATPIILTTSTPTTTTAPTTPTTSAPTTIPVTAYPTNGASCCTDPSQCSPVVECASGLQCCQQRPLWMGSIGGYCYDPSTSTCASCPVYNPNHPEQQVCSGLDELCCAGGCVSSNDYQCCHAYGSYASWVCPAGSTCCGFAPLFQEPPPSQMQCCAPGQTCSNGTCV